MIQVGPGGWGACRAQLEEAVMHGGSRRPWFVAHWRSCCAPLPALPARWLGERRCPDIAQPGFPFVAHRHGPGGENRPNSPEKLRESRFCICCALTRHGREGKAAARRAAPGPSCRWLPCPKGGPVGFANVAHRGGAAPPGTRCHLHCQIDREFRDGAVAENGRPDSTAIVARRVSPSPIAASCLPRRVRAG